MREQICRVCRNEYPLNVEHFGPEPANRNGFRSTCHGCRADEARTYYANNSLTLRAKARERRQRRAVEFRALGLYDPPNGAQNAA
jgi:hypothetical protein